MWTCFVVLDRGWVCCLCLVFYLCRPCLSQRVVLPDEAPRGVHVHPLASDAGGVGEVAKSLILQRCCRCCLRALSPSAVGLPVARSSALRFWKCVAVLVSQHDTCASGIRSPLPKPSDRRTCLFGIVLGHERK